MKSSFVMGIVAGTVAGVVASAFALDSMRPDVTAKMYRNGRKVWNRCKKQIHID